MGTRKSDFETRRTRKIAEDEDLLGAGCQDISGFLEREVKLGEMVGERQRLVEKIEVSGCVL